MFISACCLLTALFLSPLFHYIWLQPGTGNANFYFAASLVHAFGQLEYQNRLTGLSTSCAPSPRTVARSSSSSLLRKGGRNTYNRYHANGSNNSAGINSSDEGFDRLFYKPRRSQPVVHPASEIPFCELEYQNRLTGLSTSCAPSPRTVARSSSSSLLRKGGRNTYNRYHANGSNNSAGINSSDEGFDRLFYKPRRSQPVVHPASEIPFCENCRAMDEEMSRESDSVTGSPVNNDNNNHLPEEMIHDDEEESRSWVMRMPVGPWWCEDCQESVTSSNLTISQLFAILRQWTPYAQLQLITIVEEIFRRGAHVDDRDGLSDMTLLHFTAKSGALGDEQASCRIANYLLDEGANLEARCKWTDMTPLHYAAYFDCPLLADLLINRGACISARTCLIDHSTPLHLAASQLSLGTARILIQAADFSVTKTGQRYDAKDAKDDEGANLEARCKWTDMTPLHYAAYFDCPLLADLLINRGACISARTCLIDHSTPLHLAASQLSLGTARILIQAADFSVTKTGQRYDAKDAKDGQLPEPLCTLRDLLAELLRPTSPQQTEDIDIEKRIIQATSNDYSTNYRNEHITNNYVNNQSLPTENSHSQQSTCSGVDWLVESENRMKQQPCCTGLFSYNIPVYPSQSLMNSRIAVIKAESGFLSPRTKRSPTNIQQQPNINNDTKSPTTSQSKKFTVSAKVTLQSMGLALGDRVCIAPGNSTPSSSSAIPISGKNQSPLTTTGVSGRIGKLRYCGSVSFGSGIWVGVELDEPVGRNNGSVAGVKSENRMKQQPCCTGLFSYNIPVYPSQSLMNSRIAVIKAESGFLSPRTKRSPTNIQQQPNINNDTKSPTTSQSKKFTVSAKVTLQSMGLALGDRVCIAPGNSTPSSSSAIPISGKNQSPLTTTGVSGRIGKLRYCGSVSFGSGIWVGVELDEPVGRNNGSVAGIQYFSCPNQHGIFAPIGRVYKTVNIDGKQNWHPVTSSTNTTNSTIVNRRSNNSLNTSITSKKLNNLKEDNRSNSSSNSSGSTSGNNTPKKRLPSSRSSYAISSTTITSIPLSTDTSLIDHHKHPTTVSSQLSRTPTPPSTLQSPGNFSHVTAKIDTGLRVRSPDISRSHHFQIGDRVLVAGQRRGVLRFIGQTQFAPGIWYGIELEQAVGKNNGSINGIRYFDCAVGHGIFAPISRIQKLPTRPNTPNLNKVSDNPTMMTTSYHSEQVDGVASRSWCCRRTPWSSTTSPMIGRAVIGRPPLPTELVNALKAVGRVPVESVEEPVFYLTEGMQVLCAGEIGIWLGIELRKPRGRHDGCVAGRRYFTCRPGHGLLVRPARVFCHGINAVNLLPPALAELERQLAIKRQESANSCNSGSSRVSSANSINSDNEQSSRISV
ncbi:CAP-Gly domain-containing linker protein 3/4 [Schistosoma bovis]|uniref:CAP-Gly domain-containing linker protein 3/4 n=1 Tax=Schistosoma bovis TaxID=6184 RepID=A0A430Q6Q4_SCHBO|nr:CAP-Gly domain-containing linker protein 3/4 [Schistosoma bovis]